MTTLATDDFNRANSTGLGANWTPNNSGFDVNSNVALCSSGSSYVRYTALGQPANDQWAQFTVGTGAVRCGVTIRHTDDNNHYLVILEGGSTPTLYSKVSGGYSSLGASGTAVATDIIYLEAQGTSIVVKKNGSAIITVTDSSLASGYCGLTGFGTLDHLDDFVYGDFGGGGGSTMIERLMKTRQIGFMTGGVYGLN